MHPERGAPDGGITRTHGEASRNRHATGTVSPQKLTGREGYGQPTAELNPDAPVIALTVTEPIPLLTRTSAAATRPADRDSPAAALGKQLSFQHSRLTRGKLANEAATEVSSGFVTQSTSACEQCHIVLSFPS